MTMATIYGITSGSYSDYSVLVLLEDKDQAESLVASLGGDDSEYGVEAFDFIRSGETLNARIIYRAMQLAKPNPEWFTQEIYVTASLDIGKTETFHEAAEQASSGQIIARGTDRERVVKSVADKVAQLRAIDAGIS